MQAKRLELAVASGQDSNEDFFEMAYAKGWTDGLPVIPPTANRVERMLSAVSRNPQEIIAVIPPRRGEATVEKIAINAVMAGCLPEYLPVVIAAIQAISHPEFPLSILNTGTNPQAPWFMVNGPIRSKLDINSGMGAMGPGWRANSTIGRAVRLILINIGGAIPGLYTRATFAWPHRNGMLMGEYEEESPWEPFHVEHGYPKNTSTITAFRITSHIGIHGNTINSSARGYLKPMGLAMASLGNLGLYGGNLVPVIAIGIEKARFLAQEGLSKSDVKRILVEESRMPLAYYDPVLQKRFADRGRVKGGFVYLIDDPEEIHILVGGGPGGHSVYAPGYSSTPVSNAVITQEI
jgi:hypothetical protein